MIGQRSWLRRLFKWAGLLLCLSTLALWLTTRWWYIRYTSRYFYVTTLPHFVALSNSDHTGTYPPGLMVRRSHPVYVHGPRFLPTFTWFRGPADDWMKVYRQVCTPEPSGEWKWKQELLLQTRIPFWCLFVVAALPTALLWWRDRGYPPGHCQKCGYDLTGNVSGVCPECGRPVSARKSRAKKPTTG